MKFREYGEVEPRTLTADSPLELDKKIIALGTQRDIIDLQFSSTTISGLRVQFSALALIKKGAR